MSELNRPILIEGQEVGLQQLSQRIHQENQAAYDYFTSDNVSWHTPEGLRLKVDNVGNLKPFYGNTIVFDLTDEEKNALFIFQNTLREKLNILASPLSQANLHLTLHDLFSSPEQQVISEELKSSDAKVKVVMEMLTKILKTSPHNRYISLVPVMIIPSVNTSLVLTYLPEGPKDFKTLYNIHRLFDSVVKLPYFLRPHITLDYFSPQNFNEKQLFQLKKALIEINQQQLPKLKLDLHRLYYQYFSSMDEYQNILGLEFVNRRQ